MNSYYCAIDLKDDAKALAFAHALEIWMNILKSRNDILDWRLSRRKLNLADAPYRDFLLEVAVESLEQLDRAFQTTGEQSDEVNTAYRNVHALIRRADFALYRPFPDPQRVERMGLL